MRGWSTSKKQSAVAEASLFATAHFGNWELSAFAHGILTEPMNVVVRPLDNAAVDALVESRRQLSGNRLIQKARRRPRHSARARRQ
jgi:KDO2-lipid IV(A) lauroyltransferase